MLKKLEDDFLYSKSTAFTYNKATIDKPNNNLDNRLDKFKDQLKIEYVYRIRLRYFWGIGKISFPVKINFKIRCHLETDVKRLFESKKR